MSQCDELDSPPPSFSCVIWNMWCPRSQEKTDGRLYWMFLRPTFGSGLYYFVPDLFFWLEFSHMTIPKCKGVREDVIFCGPERRNGMVDI